MIFLLILHADIEKIEHIFKGYERPLYYFVYTIVKDRHLAEDALQDTFCKIIRNIERIEDAGSERAKSYIYAIARNAAIDIYNKEKENNGNTVPFDENTPIDDFKSKETIANANLDILDECLSCLSESDQEIVALKYELDLSDKQIAGVLNVSDVAVRQRLYRARKRLANAIKEFRSEGGGEK